MGIEVLPPDVNESQLDFAVVEGKIRFGLSAVKNVSKPAARAIIRGRGGGRAVHVDLGVLRAGRPAGVEQAGARVSGEVRRPGFDRGDAARDARGARGGALARGTGADRPAARAELAVRRGGEARERADLRRGVEKSELLRLEKEVLGLYVSEHPLHAIRDQLRRKTDCALADVERRRDGEMVTVGGIVSALKHLTTKKGEPMVFMRLDDVTGGAEVVVFNSVYAHARELCVMDRILVVKGRIDHKQEGETKLLAMEVAPFEAVAERKEVTIKIDARRARAGVVRDLALLVKD